MTSWDLLLALVWLGAVCGFFAAAETLQTRFGTRAELLRKISHVGSGTLALASPALFSSPLPLLALSLLAVPLLLAAGRARWPAATCGVTRRSQGAAYFALAVFLLTALFWEAHVDAFMAGMIVLAFGDGFAGVVGELGARRRYTVWRNTRSLEGSLAMFGVSVVALTALLLARGGVPPAASLAIAAAVAGAATAVEAVSPGGSDNLWVPLVAGFTLLRLLPSPAPQLAP